MKIKSYEKKEDAEKMIEVMRGGRIQYRPEYDDYIILRHRDGCTCGRCPVLYDDGYIR
jgi:hypothetical protein